MRFGKRIWEKIWICVRVESPDKHLKPPVVFLPWELEKETHPLRRTPCANPENDSACGKASRGTSLPSPLQIQHHHASKQANDCFLIKFRCKIDEIAPSESEAVCELRANKQVGMVGGVRRADGWESQEMGDLCLETACLVYYGCGCYLFFHRKRICKAISAWVLQIRRICWGTHWRIAR